MESITARLNEVEADNINITEALKSNNEDEKNTNLLLGETLTELDDTKTRVSKLEFQVGNSVIGFSLCGSALALGSSLMTAGCVENNIPMIVSGASIDVLSIGIWLFCHYGIKVF